ncbi:MAG TPA: heparan-alpha-glucosaminide N-acetyltransferase domain-containing protein [Chthoniobacteraceae bacterium]|nr:heparan-alpha-glucosaminide N-acetyltransferase domain-containing protein [Chthoniobacteraceae bacterium]
MAPQAPGRSETRYPRLASLDALRGFDMFWILGGGALARGLHAVADVPAMTWLGDQMEHVPWEGFHFYDLIFPMFVFIAGASLVFSTARHIETRGSASAIRHIVLRGVILFLLGVLYSGGIARGLENVRWLGVLQRIAIAYVGAGFLLIWCKPPVLVAVCVALLAGYWALLALVPVPEFGAGNFAEGRNLTNYLDRLYLPGRKYDGDHDPEGLLSNLPAIASCLLGVLSGLWLRGAAPPWRKALGLLVAGALLLGVGWLWAGAFPVVKKLWTSSFVLVAGGWSAILLGLFYSVIEIGNVRKPFAPFIWIGMNPITLYLLANIINFSQLAQRFAGGDVKNNLNSAVHQGAGDLLLAVIACVFPVLIAWFLYRRKVFIRV